MYLAQYSYTTTTTSGSSGAWIAFGLLYVIVLAVFLTAGWKIFTKAGQKGWKILIPFYNTITTLRIVGFSGWYILLFFIPVVNIVLAVIVAYKLAVAFGYGIGMTILEFIFGIGYLIIAFGDSKYHGVNGSHTSKPVAAAPAAANPAPPKPTHPPVRKIQ